jgi:hypothetical protein
MTPITVTFEINDGNLRSLTDQRLALLWHVAQANPAPHGNKAAGEVVEHIGREIVRRWLAGVEPELWKHQGRSYYWQELGRFAKYVPGSRDAMDPAWHDGEWVLKEDAPTGEATSRSATTAAAWSRPSPTHASSTPNGLSGPALVIQT